MRRFSSDSLFSWSHDTLLLLSFQWNRNLCRSRLSQCHSFWSKVDEDWFDFLSKRHQNREWRRNLTWRWEEDACKMMMTKDRKSKLDCRRNSRKKRRRIMVVFWKSQTQVVYVDLILCPPPSPHFLIPWRCFVLGSFCYYPSSWFPIKVEDKHEGAGGETSHGHHLHVTRDLREFIHSIDSFLVIIKGEEDGWWIDWVAWNEYETGKEAYGSFPISCHRKSCNNNSVEENIKDSLTRQNEGPSWINRHTRQSSFLLLLCESFCSSLLLLCVWSVGISLTFVDLFAVTGFHFLPSPPVRFPCPCTCLICPHFHLTQCPASLLCTSISRQTSKWYQTVDSLPCGEIFFPALFSVSLSLSLSLKHLRFEEGKEVIFDRNYHHRNSL